MSPKIQYGININSNPQAPDIRPANPADLKGLQWVRMVFLFHDIFNQFGYDLNHWDVYDDALNRAFAFYDPLIASYAQRGVRTLLILNQESFSGNAPWFPNSIINWDAAAADQFATVFADFCGKVAAHYRGKNIAFEIWNEGDVLPGHQNEGQATSVYIKPEFYGPILHRAAAKIKNAAPDSLVISGGMASGAGDAVQYLRALGDLPVDAIAIHPYGQYLGPNKPHIPSGWFGLLDDTLKIFVNAFPGKKFWITEMGVSENHEIPQEFWPAIADYMEGVCNRVQEKYSSHISTLVWFGWSDRMRNAGIVDIQGQRKQPIYNRFFKIAGSPGDAPIPVPVPVPGGDQPGVLLTLNADAASLNVREGAGTQFDIKDIVHSGDRLVVVEADPDAALRKIGQHGEWIQIRTPNNVVGYVAAWFVMRVITPFAVPIPDNTAAGRQRALDFDHDPEFIYLPVVSNPTDVQWFNGFGPNNFAYHDYVSNGNHNVAYARIFGIHNGLDFGVPHGTLLRACDWGRVVQVSAQPGDVPFGAKPFTIAIRYGRFISVYGHMSRGDVAVGDIVKPGQQIGLSGTDPSDGPHLHFETRELSPNYIRRLATQAAGSPNLAEAMDNLFDLATARRNIIFYKNPALFFTTPLESYHWHNGLSFPAVDTDGNGYPDRVVTAGQTQPFAYDLYWMSAYAPGRQGSFWDSSHAV